MSLWRNQREESAMQHRKGIYMGRSSNRARLQSESGATFPETLPRTSMLEAPDVRPGGLRISSGVKETLVRKLITIG
jgi:hypothetical protein